jgi:ATP-binding cassette subfamily C protein
MVAHSKIDPTGSIPALASAREFIGDFLRFIGPRRWSAGALLFLGAIVEGVGLLMLLPILTVVLGTTAAAGPGQIDEYTRGLIAMLPGATPLAQLVVLLGFYGLLLALRSIIIIARDTTLARLQVGFVEAHRLQIIRLIAGTRWNVISRLKHGRVTHVLGGDIQACGDAAHLFLQSCVALTMLAGQCLLVLLLSPELALLVVLLLAGAALMLRPVLRKSRRLGGELTQSNLSLVTSTSQFLGGLKLALSQNLQGGFVDEFKETLTQAGECRIDFHRQRSRAQVSLTAAAAALGGLALLVGIGFSEATPTALIAFLIILTRMNGPVAILQNSAQYIAHSLPAYRKIKNFEAELCRYQEPDDVQAVSTPRLRGDVKFEDVRFVHRDAQGANVAGGLLGINLLIEQGSFVGITGPSGAGKTTLADLLVGLYPPQSGIVAIGGKALEGQTLSSWRSSVSYVSQDPFLFHDSVRRNLLWARPGAGEDELWDALERTGAAELVRRMPAGLDTLVGERGTLISGGERQRLALARALLRKPTLLLLDEATNAIDVEGEKAILSDLRGDASRPTIVIIAHREASLALCERIIELRDGRLVEV